MHIEYRDNQTFDQNIQSLAGHLEAKLRDRTKERETIEPFPSTNVPSCIQANQEALANFDAESERIGHRATAAREGYLLVDPDDLRIPLTMLDPKARKWKSEARREGRILTPAQYAPTMHSFSGESPLLIRRGEPATQFGRGEASPLGFNTTRR